MNICWINVGVSSFIAAHLYKEGLEKIVYIHIEDQGENSLRSIKDCRKALGKEVKIIKSDDFSNVEEVCRKYRYVNGPYEAKCTTILKKVVGEEWERENLQEMPTYTWGYGSSEKRRAKRAKKDVIEANHKFPLIKNNLTKEDCHTLLKQLGAKKLKMYEFGYHNNSCVECVKGGKGYWNKIRKDLPEVFGRRAKLEREIGASYMDGAFLDELNPDAGRNQREVLEDCSLFCQTILNEVEVEG